MAEFDLNSFASKFQGGARQYLFYIKPNIPTGGDMDLATYMVSSGSLPGRTIEENITPWQGMDFKSAGKATYDSWEVTFRVDRKGQLKTYFDNWMEVIHDPITNKRSLPSQYMADQTTQLLDEVGSVIKEYRLIDAWPSAVAQIDLDYGGSEIAMFSVTFTYQYYVIII